MCHVKDTVMETVSLVKLIKRTSFNNLHAAAYLLAIAAIKSGAKLTSYVRISHKYIYILGNF